MDTGSIQILTEVARFRPPVGDEPTEWVEHLRTEPMSVGTYCIPAGGVDDQEAHREDELYVVLAGEAVLSGGDQAFPMSVGSAAFVPAGQPHRFVDIAADLTVLVVFAPAYSGRG